MNALTGSFSPAPKGDELPLLSDALNTLLPEPPVGNDTRQPAIVTGIEGHEFYASPAVQNKAALTEDGVLLLVEGARSDVLVMSYIASLDRRRELSNGRIVPYTSTKTISHSELRQLYAEMSGPDVANSKAAQRTTEQAQVVSMIAEAANEQASDIFIEISDDAAEIQYRIAGDIERRFGLKPDHAKRLIRTIYDSMCEAASDGHYDPSRDQSGRIGRRHIDGLNLHRIRVSTGPTDEERPFLALRLHYDLGEPQPLVSLGFTPEHEAAITAVTHRPYGIVLFSGPTGAGKSTSLANLIGYRQKQDNCCRKVISLEDPPEIPIYGTVHKAVLRKGQDRDAEGLAWIAGFETLMRWNPNWIIAGELRLRETMDAALKSALTGHLTWGMLHASSATLVPVRLQEAGIELGYLCDPDIFPLFCNQSLVPKLCPFCSVPYSRASDVLDKESRARIEKHCTPDSVRLRGKGCEHCYRGVQRVRTVCAEVMSTDRALLSVFRDHGALAFRRYWVHERGGLTKGQHMISKINTGELDPVIAERMVLPLDDDLSLRG